MSGPILYFTRYLPTYRVPILQELDRRLGGSLIVCTGHAGGSSLSTIEATAEDLTIIRIPDFWISGEKVHGQAFWRAFKGVRPGAVIAEESPRTATLPLLMAYCRVKKIPFALWGHYSSNARPMGSGSPLDRYRIAMASQADVCITYTESQAIDLRRHVDHACVVVARNTLDTNVLESARRRLAEEGRQAVRERVGLIKDALTIVYVGRLIADKGVLTLLDVLKTVQEEREAQLVVVGDGDLLPEMKRRVGQQSIHGVHFLGAISDLVLSAPYLYSADVMLVPGYLGLQVNHAFSFGVPVVSRSSPGPERFHSPEVDFIEEGRNGLLVDTPDAREFADAVVLVADDPNYSENALRYAQEHLRMEYMVDGLERAINMMMGRSKEETK